MKIVAKGPIFEMRPMTALNIDNFQSYEFLKFEKLEPL